MASGCPSAALVRLSMSDATVVERRRSRRPASDNPSSATVLHRKRQVKPALAE